MRSVLLGGALAIGLAMAQSATAAPTVTGEYLEARTANVYIGACHAGSEFGTTGREAVLAWRIGGGEWQGQKLKGLAAVAVMAGNDNLSRDDVRRQTMLYLDASATDPQRKALLSLLREKYAATFGEIVGVTAAPITFGDRENVYVVRVGDTVRLDVKKEANKTCCTMPMEVWYQPFVPVRDQRIGYSSVNEFKGAAQLPSWTRRNQNSAIFGSFGF
jgi:hypothetical protein